LIESLRFLPVADAELATKYAVASGVFELDQGFYGQLFSDKDIALRNIVKALSEPGGDLGCGLVAYNSDDAVGYLSFFPVVQKTTRNLATLKSILDLTTPDSRQKLKLSTAFQQQLAPLISPGFYLNKILIFPGSQGASFGYRLFNYYLQESEKLHLAPVFHVKRDNQSAIKFYERQGFEVQESEHEYVLCKKK
jgi:ribosomal protein S18 acetylase RimI-like enzyme